MVAAGRPRMTGAPRGWSDRVHLSRVAGGVLFALACLVVSSVSAEEFLGVEVEKSDRTYVITKDVNVRDKPDTSAKRVAGLKSGDRVHVVGRYMGWFAIERDGSPLGFAFHKYMVPLIDGELDDPVRGSAIVDGDGRCAYEIVYAGRSAAEVEEFAMLDYEVNVQCERDGVQMSFVLYMFMTEGAYHPSKPNVHQIGIDMLEIQNDGDYDKSFTTNLFYNSEKKEVDFSEITIDAYAGKPLKEEVTAASVPEAVKVAVGMALESWNANAWDDLKEALAGSGN